MKRVSAGGGDCIQIHTVKTRTGSSTCLSARDSRQGSLPCCYRPVISDDMRRSYGSLLLWYIEHPFCAQCTLIIISSVLENRKQ